MVARLPPRCERIAICCADTRANPASHPAVDFFGGRSSEYFGCQLKSRIDAKVTGF